MQSDSTPIPEGRGNAGQPIDGHSGAQPHPQNPQHSVKPSMPPVKVTWKTTVAQAKDMAAKLDAEFEALNAGNQSANADIQPEHGNLAPPNDLAQLATRWKAAQQQFGEYHPMAYQFVREGVRHTVEMIHGLREMQEREGGTLHAPDSARHVSAQQLCYGLKDLAMDRYGGMAHTVLSHWGIRATRDVGNIVFAMLAVGILGRSDSDALEQFDSVFDLSEELAFPA